MRLEANFELSKYNNIKKYFGACTATISVFRKALITITRSAFTSLFKNNQLKKYSSAELRAVSARMNCRQVTTSFPGSLFSASLSLWNRDPGCGWSRDHLSIQNRRVGGYSSTFGREENPVAPPFKQIFLPGHVNTRNQGLCSNA